MTRSLRLTRAADRALHRRLKKKIAFSLAPITHPLLLYHSSQEHLEVFFSRGGIAEFRNQSIFFLPRAVVAAVGCSLGRKTSISYGISEVNSERGEKKKE